MYREDVKESLTTMSKQKRNFAVRNAVMSHRNGWENAQAVNLGIRW